MAVNVGGKMKYASAAGRVSDNPDLDGSYRGIVRQPPDTPPEAQPESGTVLFECLALDEDVTALASAVQALCVALGPVSQQLPQSEKVQTPLMEACNCEIAGKISCSRMRIKGLINDVVSATALLRV